MNSRVAAVADHLQISQAVGFARVCKGRDGDAVVNEQLDAHGFTQFTRSVIGGEGGLPSALPLRSVRSGLPAATPCGVRGSAHPIVRPPKPRTLARAKRVFAPQHRLLAVKHLATPLTLDGDAASLPARRPLGGPGAGGRAVLSVSDVVAPTLGTLARPLLRRKAERPVAFGRAVLPAFLVLGRVEYLATLLAPVVAAVPWGHVMPPFIPPLYQKRPRTVNASDEYAAMARQRIADDDPSAAVESLPPDAPLFAKENADG